MAKQTAPKKAAVNPRTATPPPAPITVSGRWLAGAVAVVVTVAAMCAYATLCLLFYQGQWQMVLHPSRSVAVSPANRGVKFDEVHFDYTETGIAKLDGWWIPADPASQWSSDVVLYLHSGEGSLANCVDDLVALHSLGINVFAFDYRGFGRSTGTRPSELRMTQDANAAWTYLTSTRHTEARSIVIYGAGVGASLAAELAARHQPAGVVLEAPSDPARSIIAQDVRAKILPLWLLLDEHFDPTDALQTPALPKLFLDPGEIRQRTQQLFKAAAFPKEYFELRQNGSGATLRRFFDEVLR